MLLLIYFFPSLLSVAALDYELIGAVLSLAGLVSKCGLAPGSYRAGTADGGLAFAAAVGWAQGFMTEPRTVGRMPM